VCGQLVRTHTEYFKEQVRAALSDLPAQHLLTKERYIESGLDILSYQHVSGPSTTSIRDQYRRLLAEIIVEIRA
jgi:hypothetical protein